MANSDEANWLAAFDAREDLHQYNDSAIGLFALALRFSIDDIHSVAVEAVTDGSDDKKCDLIYIDREEGVAVVAQCYTSKKQAAAARANKAADLNTAVGWLLRMPIDRLPERLRPATAQLRDAIQAGQIRRFEAWYVHNLPESNNVREELETVSHTSRALLNQYKGGKKIEFSALEVGKQRLEEWYSETLSPILVNDEIDFDIVGGFSLTEGDWSAYVTTVPATTLHKLYKRHTTRLFSANVRDYLGSRDKDANINNGIKTSARDTPRNFWVFNNGITVLTHSFEPRTVRGKRKLVALGVSIVNGAQTTGALGSLNKADPNVLVPARFVSTSKPELVYDIIRFNNSQNKVTASDFRSTDRIQKRLRDEVDAIPNASYEGGRRGGHQDTIERNRNLMPSYTVGQALAAYHQEPVVAYNQKSDIWVRDSLYTRFFNEDTTGQHLVFCYGLLRAAEDLKRSLIVKSTKKTELTEQENGLLAYFRQRGALYLFVSAVAACMETIVSKPIAVPAKVSFGPKTSPAQSKQYWANIISILSPFCQQLGESDGLKSVEKAKTAIATFRTLVQVTAIPNAEVYRQFARHVVIDR